MALQPFGNTPWEWFSDACRVPPSLLARSAQELVNRLLPSTFPDQNDEVALFLYSFCPLPFPLQNRLPLMFISAPTPLPVSAFFQFFPVFDVPRLPPHQNPLLKELINPMELNPRLIMSVCETTRAPPLSPPFLVTE